jgi:glyoxylase-like metal-dependent hydrolase (beta-lactamase superfamily II)
MQLGERIHLVGSGALGFDLTDPFDCHVYLLDGGDELALVDAGSGIGAEAILENVRQAGFDPGRIGKLLLTHAHGDHAGGAARMRGLVGGKLDVCLSAVTAGYLREGDERGVSIDVAKTVGIYPPDYRYEPCAVDVELRDGDEIAVGDLTLRVLDTPGHCDGHVSYVLDHAGGRVLFAGDVVFFGGRILLQAIHDCRLDEQVRSLRRLRDLEVSALLSGHSNVALADGQRHIERANRVLDGLLIPEQLVSGWAA